MRGCSAGNLLVPFATKKTLENVLLTCSDLALLAGSFALLGHYSGNVANALDAVLGFAKRRIDSRHLNAVSRLDHTAQVRCTQNSRDQDT